MIEKRCDWHKPAILLSQPPHESPKVLMQFAVLPETGSEVSIHYAYPTFAFESVLVGFTQHGAEAIDAAPFTATEPEINEWLGRIMIRKSRIDSLQIYFVKDEVAYITDAFLTKVAPEVGGLFEVTLEGVPVAGSGGQVVCDPNR